MMKLWHLVIWLIVAFWAALWSGFAWALHTLVRLTQGRAWGDPGAGDWLDRWSFPAWMADWLPMSWLIAFKAWLTQLGLWLDVVWVHAPWLAGWAQAGIWLGWLAGIVLLALVGIACSTAIAVIARDRNRPAAAVPAARGGVPTELRRTD